jgi:hypothetical protein
MIALRCFALLCLFAQPAATAVSSSSAAAGPSSSKPSLRGSGVAAATRDAGAAEGSGRQLVAVEDSDFMIRGVSWGPVPLKGAGSIPQDDWMSEAAKPLWGRRGRGDLRQIAALGANMVRLYGNNPDNNHRGFLDAAWAEGLHVTPSMSDWPYFQMPDSCQTTDFNCYSQVKESYLQNLKGGFLMEDGTYHPAIKYMIILNEPDLKMPSTATFVAGGPRQMSKSLLSAMDAMLDAEKEAGLVGPGINFTATFSFAVCTVCDNFTTKPALGMIAQFKHAVQDPEAYGYAPHNDLAKAYRERFTNSFNTANPATEMRPLILDDYEQTFPATPVFIGEYHNVHVDLETDLRTIKEIAAGSPLFLGISFFQYQVAYWKGGTEMEFGMFGLGDYVVAPMDYFGSKFDVYCLQPASSSSSGAHAASMPDALAAVYGGRGVDVDTLCVQSPDAAPLTPAGYQTMSNRTASQMAAFVTRVVQHLGAVVRDQEGLATFAEQQLGAPVADFGTMVEAIAAKPSWTAFDPSAVCVADSEAFASDVGLAVEFACGQDSVNCSSIPDTCKGSIFDTADWVFSTYYQGTDALQNCYFGGSALFASTSLLGRKKPSCVNGWDGAVTDLDTLTKSPEEPVSPSPTSAGPGTTTTASTSAGGSPAAAIVSSTQIPSHDGTEANAYDFSVFAHSGSLKAAAPCGGLLVSTVLVFFLATLQE